MVHRRPEKQAAEMTRQKPARLNSASPATSMSRPAEISRTVPPRDHVGTSMRQIKANMSRNSGADALHLRLTTFVDARAAFDVLLLWCKPSEGAHGVE